jgi:hydroxymethylglutaryl-CoA lyase
VSRASSAAGTGEAVNAVQIVDVSLRDGLQSFHRIVSTDDKLRLLEILVAGGITAVELGAFVRPDLVPEMADTPLLFERTTGRWPDVQFFALVLNVKGAERALASGARELRMVVSATEGHSWSNSHRSVTEGIREAAAVASLAHREGARVAVGLATAFACPYDGIVPAARVVDLVGQLVDGGFEFVSLADTLGRAHPGQVAETIGAARGRYPDVVRSVHLHNTYGLAIANAVAALDAGIRSFDAAVGGIGGCPFAPGAAGNVATEDLLLLLTDLGYDTGLSLEAVGETVRSFYGTLGEVPVSSVAQAMGWTTPIGATPR